MLTLILFDGSLEALSGFPVENSFLCSTTSDIHLNNSLGTLTPPERTMLASSQLSLRDTFLTLPLIFSTVRSQSNTLFYATFHSLYIRNLVFFSSRFNILLKKAFIFKLKRITKEIQHLVCFDSCPHVSKCMSVYNRSGRIWLLLFNPVLPCM